MSVPTALAPRFDGASLLNLAATLELAASGTSRHAPLADASLRDAILTARPLVLWLIDGLGIEPLRELAPGSALAGAVAGEVAAIFPSSTAPTLTTLTTGLSVAEHGLPEWFVWFDELGAIYRSLPLDPRDPASPLPRLADARPVYEFEAIYSRASRPAFAVMPRHVAHSAYSAVVHAGCTTLPWSNDEELLAAVLAASAVDGAMVYVYDDRFDRTCHRHGVASDAAQQCLARLDQLFVRLAAGLSRRGGTLLVSADHGFVDIDPALRWRLEDFPAIADCLARPLCGGPRTPIVSVRPGREAELVERVGFELGPHFSAVASKDLLAAGWFGPGSANPRLLARLGSHVLLPTGDAVLVDRLPAEAAYDEIGVHGGCSPAETRVPLILV